MDREKRTQEMKETAHGHSLQDTKKHTCEPASSTPPTFGEAAPILYQNGYQPIPIRSATKIPSTENWQIPQKPNFYIKSRRCGKDGVGILTAKSPVIDIDILNTRLVDDLIELADEVFESQAPKRVGHSPKSVLLYQIEEEPFTKKYSPWFIMPGDDWSRTDYRAHRIEILNLDTMFVSYAKHPKTGKTYVWSRGDPLTVPCADLPTLTAALADLYLEAAWQVAVRHGACPVRQRRRQWVAAPLPETKEEHRSVNAYWKQLSIDDLRGPLKLRRSGKGWATRCLVHCGEHDNSLNFTQTDDGLLVHCFAGCTFEEISEAICEVLDEIVDGIN